MSVQWRHQCFPHLKSVPNHYDAIAETGKFWTELRTEPHTKRPIHWAGLCRSSTYKHTSCVDIWRCCCCCCCYTNKLKYSSVCGNETFASVLLGTYNILHDKVWFIDNHNHKEEAENNFTNSRATSGLKEAMFCWHYLAMCSEARSLHRTSGPTAVRSVPLLMNVTTIHQEYFDQRFIPNSKTN